MQELRNPRVDSLLERIGVGGIFTHIQMDIHPYIQMDIHPYIQMERAGV